MSPRVTYPPPPPHFRTKTNNPFLPASMKSLDSSAANHPDFTIFILYESLRSPRYVIKVAYHFTNFLYENEISQLFLLYYSLCSVEITLDSSHNNHLAGLPLLFSYESFHDV
ncbi:hypothetical protein AVEN_84773-1 [Araneus ventricosus]|uniref:Uncharacterized protein n=1 Tax=Araneus ventricosus TaxID=182803 RepID=A0A4Y2WEG7_ARAVE|nr:hypothetical protein AVEN_84773-1 [Araneus ventricosus]